MTGIPCHACVAEPADAVVLVKADKEFAVNHREVARHGLILP
jgi:hypothetical protein